MKTLRIFLGAIYVVLIILLLLLGLKNCNRTTKVDTPIPINTTEPDTTIVAERDTIAEKEAEELEGSGDLEVVLLWNFEGDIDLHVVEPSGYEIYFNHMTSPETGGYLNIDNQDGGEGSKEKVYWVHPPKGQYKVFLRYYRQTLPDSLPQECKVVVSQVGREPQTYRVPMMHQGDIKQVTVIDIEQ